jgi:DNA-binding transcriptional LysR family regulator
MAERAEEAEASLSSLIGEADGEAVGAVRIAAPAILCAQLFAPALPLLRQLAPGVVVELIAAGEHDALSRREADIALRFARPSNSSFLARRIATLQYAVYALRGRDGATLPWIDFDETLADLPEARWLAARIDKPVIARAADLQTMYQAVRSGCCVGLLPTAIARRDGMLVAQPMSEAGPSRELWLLVERQMRQIRRVSLSLGWVEALVRDVFAPATP